MSINKKNVYITSGILLTILLIFLLLTMPFSFSVTTDDSAWDGVIATSFTQGTGTEENPYVISSAGEFAYLKTLLEGEEADSYLDKTYVLNSGFNYGDYNITINNSEPFTGTIDGKGNIIYNASINNHLFTSMAGATIKNITINEINYTLQEENGALLTNEINDSTIEMVILSGNVSVPEGSTFGGIVYSSSNTEYNKIILNYNVISDSENIYKIAYETDKDEFSNILVNSDDVQITNSEAEIEVDTFEIKNNQISLLTIDNINEYSNDNYQVTINNNIFSIEEKITEKDNNDKKDDEPIITPTPKDNNRGPAKAAASNTPITPHASGVDGTTIYINDLDADYNYLKGLNRAEIRNTLIPSGTSTGYYDDDYLVKVQIIYDGVDINNSNLVGAVSPLSSENTNKYVYYKYYPLERNSSGTLLTNSDGDNYIKIELIDNPFSKRPYISSSETEYGFNGWVCNQDTNSSQGLCDNSKFILDKETYTRYMEVSADGDTEIKIHLNASWVKANVTTSSSQITNFPSQMQNIPTHEIQITIPHTGSPYWRRNYTTMVYQRSYSGGTRMPTNQGYWFKTNQSSLTYNRVRTSNRTCPNGSTCYVYTPNTSGITSGSIYNETSIEFIVSHSNSNYTETAIVVTEYNETYHELRDNPNGTYTWNTYETRTIPDLEDGDTAGGYFYKVSNPTAAMINTREYYNASGELCENASSCTTAYKLIHYNDSRTNSDGSSIYEINETNNYSIVDVANYYYLPTRDTNIFRYTSTTTLSYSNLRVNKPFTVTGTSVTGQTPTGVINLNTSSFSISNDLVIENIKIYGPNQNLMATNYYGEYTYNDQELGDDSKDSGVIYANSHNLKIGRNITSSRGDTYIVAESIFGGTNSSVSGTFKVIVESGVYYAYHSGVMSTSNSNFTMNEITILGSDYDRIMQTNNKLRFTIGLDGYAGGHHSAGSSSLFASFTIVKSGTLGYNYDGTANSDNTAGMYIGGRASKCVNSITGAKVEGGLINTIVGGYAYNGTSTTNSTYIGMSGGSVREIYGGAGHSTTVGNRIINATGGTVAFSILGGSDSNSTTDTADGVVQGSTLIYVGGNIVIGDGSNNTLNGVETGSVFGAGGGREGDQYVAKGTVYNSHVIVEGGTINRSVYGGGNFGSTGTQSDTSASTVIEILGGTIGNVYGGSKSSGFGTDSYDSSSMIEINVSGGTIGNIYGGSNTKGTVKGSVEIEVTGGSITGNVYGGGQGQPTIVTHGVEVKIGNNNTGPSITGNVYGGSAFGLVNSTTSGGTANGNTAVIVNNGTIQGSVFGGGQGDSNVTPIVEPHVEGNITVTINGGDITSVFGGNDQAGSHTKTNQVYLNGGTIGSVYGGGNKSSVTTTNVYLQGSTVTTLYGGSNTSGSVSTANVTLSSGTVGTAYGGNNVGGSCTSTVVTVQGTSTVQSELYGGGKSVNTTTTRIELYSANGTIPSVYGGGYAASVTNSATINQRGATVGYLYGGSNSSGSVASSIINHNSGTSNYIYGGNNAGGSTLASQITYTSGTSTNIFGGGKNASHGTASISVTNGSISGTIYGGGDNEGVTSTTVTIGNSNTTSLSIGTVFGGSNAAGNVPVSSVTINAGTIGNVYGGNNSGGTLTNPTITVTGGTITNGLYGGGYQARALNNATINISNGTIGNVFGGGKLAELTGNVNLTMTGGSVTGSIYGGGDEGAVGGNTTVILKNCSIGDKAFAGGNEAIVNGNTTINVGQNTIVGSSNSTGLGGSVFGSGNKAATGTNTNDNSVATVNITGGTIYGNVYGGANTSVVYGTVSLNIGKNTITNNTLLSTLGYSDITIHGTIFGGGESNAEGSPSFDYDAISVTQGIDIKIDGTGYNNFNTYGSIFGSGNASNTPANKPSTITIKNYGTSLNPHYNQSIQRTKNLIIDNSSIELSGVRDSTDDYHPHELFSLNRIEHLYLKNNSSLFLRKGTNYLEEFNSVDANGVKAAVQILDDGTVTKTVDNRLYTIEGGHVNIAHDGSNTDNGNVYGMTFFGMYNINNSGVVSTKMYNPNLNNGDSINWGDVPNAGSYVLGKHETNHNIMIDGFYTNYFDEENVAITVGYIEPTPEASPYYYWTIGETVTEYTVNLEASKYSTLGTEELLLRGLEAPNTSFQILGFDYSGLASGISLVDKSTIRGLASTNAIANSTFGLSIETGNVGWLTSGFTNFYNNSNQPFNGKDYYTGDNTSDAPSFLFYLYHYKNLTDTMDLGTVVIQMMAITEIDDINSELERIIITVNLSTIIINTSEYEGAMTPGKKYELFASTTTKITDKSSFSAYYSLFGANTNLYQTGYKHVLTSNYVFPENTKLTLIDMSLDAPRYYYYIITSQDVTDGQTELSTYNEVTYPLSKFLMMDTTGNNHYDDAAMNALYYRPNIGSYEEYIVHVDFADTASLSDNQLNMYLYPELQNAGGNLIIGALGTQRSSLQFSLYKNSTSTIEATATISSDTIYNGNTSIIEVESTFRNNELSSETIYDTTHNEDNLGLLIYLTTEDEDELGNPVTKKVSGNALLGAYFSIHGINYFPDAAGDTRLKFADRVGNIKSYITFNMLNSSIKTGDYTINIEIFGSPDGIHYSNADNMVSSVETIDVEIILSSFGLNAELSDSSLIIVNDGEAKQISGTIEYTSQLDNPNIKVRMYRRDYSSAYSTNYILVDFQDYILDTLTTSAIQKGYTLIPHPSRTNSFRLNVIPDDLLTGTYRLDFELYDNNALIGKHSKYIVIKNKYYDD